ncbi:MAG: hypothetical protein U0350_21435 [Caldilineaceae bacterium]
MRVSGVTRTSWFSHKVFSHKVAQVSATVVCLLSLLILPGGAWAAQTPNSPDLLGSIAGVVTNNQGTPLPNIEVSALISYGAWWGDISYSPVRIGSTDVAGAYRLPALSTGIYRLQFRDPGKQYALEFYQHANTAPAGAEVPVAGNNLTGINTSLTLGGRITGTLTIQNELLVLSGNADIYTQGSSGWQIVATVPITQAGRYDSGSLLPGVYRVCATGYYPSGSFRNCFGNRQTVQNAADITIGAAEVKANQNIDLSAGQFDGAISGVVMADGAPKAGIKVGLFSPYYYDPYPYLLYAPFAYTLTDQAGHYTIGGLTASTYIVGFSDPAGVYASSFFQGQTIPEVGTSISLQNSQVISDVNASLAHGGKISGHVQRVNGAPVTNVVVQLYWQSTPVVPPVPTPTATPGPFAAAATPTPALTPTPAPAAVYWQRMTSYYTKTDAAGNYTLQGLWPGTYRLSFQLCPVASYGAGCESEFYGAPYYDVLRATDIKVEADKTTAGINLTLGPDHLYYMPLAAR